MPKPKNRIVSRLIKIVTDEGKFDYGTPAQCLSIVEYVFAAHRRMSDNLQNCVQKHGLGLGGEPVDELVIDALEQYMRFPPPVDNEFVAEGCELFGQSAKILGKIGGSSCSIAKKKAARENGKLGGRPLKTHRKE